MFDFIKDNPLIFILIFLAIAAPSLLFGALQVVGYIILGVIILLIILSIVFRVKVRKFQNQMRDQMNGQGGFYEQSSSSRQRATHQEGDDVKIFKSRGSGEKRVSKDVGDYVEFEEIKESK